MKNEFNGRLDWLMFLYTAIDSSDFYRKEIVKEMIWKEFHVDPKTLIREDGWVLPKTLDEILGLE